MFTGIIETLGQIVGVAQEGSNIHFKIQSSISDQLKVDQSVAHDGVCLTVTALDGDIHQVTAVAETLQRSNLSGWQVGSLVNLERAMMMGARLDGHMVQGHVDDTATCITRKDENGSWAFHFEFNETYHKMLVDKGSVCINGVSLTVVQPSLNSFSVAIIPYTFEHTSFKQLKVGQKVNIEFDILGKYIAKHLASLG